MISGRGALAFRAMVPVRFLQTATTLSLMAAVFLASTADKLYAQGSFPGYNPQQGGGQPAAGFEGATPGAFPTGQPGGFGAPGGQPGFGAPGGQPGGLPGLPGLPGAEGAGAPGLSSSEPPPLVGTLGIAAETTSTASTSGTATVPSETYEFIFRDDPDMGIVREKYTADEAKEAKEREINRIIEASTNPDNPGQGAAGGDPRAVAEWDFFYEQMQMYHEYVMKKCLPGVEITAPLYDVTNYLQERKELSEEYQRKSVDLANDLLEANRKFYERLDAREDKRRNYLNWVEQRRDDLLAWSNSWGSNVEGSNFRAGNAVNRDDWYRGANFGNPATGRVTVAGRSVVVSKQPVMTAPNELNAVSTNLTPYDLIDSQGRARRSGSPSGAAAPASAPGRIMVAPK